MWILRGINKFIKKISTSFKNEVVFIGYHKYPNTFGDPSLIIGQDCLH